MIVKCVHPDNPDHQYYLALRFDDNQGSWSPPVAGDDTLTVSDDKLDAVRVCLAYVLSQWSRLAGKSRVLRALCEHPEFDFSYDGIDSEIVRVEARALTEMIDVLTIDITRLLDEPGASDRVRLGHKRIAGSPGMSLVLRADADEAESDEQSELAAAARADFRALLDLMRHMIAGVVAMIVERHGPEVQAILVDEEIAWLGAMKERTVETTSRHLHLIDDVEENADDFATKQTGEYPPLGPSDTKPDDNKPSSSE